MLMTLALFALPAVAAALFYLTHPNQGWRLRPLPRRPAVGAALVLLALALAAGLQVLAPLALLFTVLLELMLVWGLLPFLGLLSGSAPAKSNLRNDKRGKVHGE